MKKFRFPWTDLIKYWVQCWQYGAALVNRILTPTPLLFKLGNILWTTLLLKHQPQEIKEPKPATSLYVYGFPICVTRI